MGIPQARKPDRTFRHTRPRTAMAAHGSPPSHRTMRHRDHATCTSITLDGPAPAGARRSLEHRASQGTCSHRKAPSHRSHPKDGHPASGPSHAAHTILAQHRPASHRYTSADAATAAHTDKRAATRSARHSARDYPLGFPRSCQPRPTLATPQACHTQDPQTRGPSPHSEHEALSSSLQCMTIARVD